MRRSIDYTQTSCAFLSFQNNHHTLLELPKVRIYPIKERNFEKPSKKSAFNFKNKLEKSGINVTIRREMGSDIDGKCNLQFLLGKLFHDRNNPAGRYGDIALTDI